MDRSLGKDLRPEEPGSVRGSSSSDLLASLLGLQLICMLSLLIDACVLE